jgi:PKD repeat protein
VTVATGIFVESLTIDFGDHTSASLGGSTSAVVPHTYTTANTYIVTVTVVDSSGQTTIGTAVISIAAT